MMRLESGRMEGGDGFVAELLEQTEGRAELAVFDAIQHLRNRVIERLTGPRSGARYFVPGEDNATYTASSPGQAPARATGELARRISAVGPESDGREISGRVGVDLQVVPYARRLEYGGVHFQREDQAVRRADGSWFVVRAGTMIRTAPRPYLRVTFDTERAAVESMMQRRLDAG